MASKLESFTDVFGDPDEICDSQPLSLSLVEDSEHRDSNSAVEVSTNPTIPCHFGSHSNVRDKRPTRGTGQHGEFRSVDEIDAKYRSVFVYPFFNIVQSRVIEDALYSDKSMVVCAPTGSGKTVVFEMAIVHLLMELEDRNENHDFKIIYMAPVKALCTERLTEWYSKFTKLGLLCIEVTGDTDVDFSQLKPYRIIITTPEKWDMLTRRWRDHRQLVEVIKLFLIDEVHILNDETRGPVLEAVVSRMKTIETSVQSTHRIEQLQQQYQGTEVTRKVSPNIRFVAVSATVSNPEDVAAWLGTADKPAVYYKFGDECRPVKLRRVVEGYPCADGASIFKFDIVLNYKLWPIIQKYYNGKPTLIFCNTRKSVALTAETLSREITISFNEEQKARLAALASAIKNKKLQTLVLSGVGCHHAGLLYEERTNIEQAFRNRDLPILITTTTLAMGVNLPAHLVIIKNTQQYVSGAYQEYSISTVLQMVGRAGRPQFDTEATAVIMTRLADKPRYQALVGGSEPLQSFLHKRLPENLNSEAALGTVCDVAQCVQWLRSTFLSVRAAKDPKRYLGLPQTAPHHQILKKIEELCVKAMNGLASTGLITMDEACCIESTEAGRLMSIFYIDLETMKHIMKIGGSESLEQLLWVVCESHELADMHLRMDERRCLNTLNRNNAASTIRFPMKGKITTRQMKLNCVIQAVLGCLPIPDPSLNQEAMKIMRIAERVCKCLVAYVTRPALVSQQSKFYSAVLNSIILTKCVTANLWENSNFVSKQLKGIGPTFSTLLATAGKFNFMLLEESHPRDLERIMNKGPPAGNILRKQISLLPKYQLTMTPIDEKSVSIQLVLLNHHNLSENLEQLTAGATHKSYVIIGDSENNLLLLTSFNDKDLIGVYDGCITYKITRKYGFEHKIYAHCVSSTIAGIDAHIEYVFQNIEPQMHPLHSENNEEFIKKPVKKQTAITDTFRERKRKNTSNELTQSKEKKKRESALFEKFKNLKESFGKTSNALKEDLDRTAVMSNMILQDLTNIDNRNTENYPNITIEQNCGRDQEPPAKSTFFVEPNTYEIHEDDFINDDFMDDDKINNILNEIECEISKEEKPKVSDKTKLYSSNENESKIQKTVLTEPASMKNNQGRNTYSLESYKNNIKKRMNKNVPKKSNYNFIDLLEKNVDLSDEEKTVNEPNSFSDTIRCHIEKYLQKAKTHVKADKILTELIQEEPVAVTSKETVPVVIIQDSIINQSDNKDSLNTNTQLENAKRENAIVVEELTINDTSTEVSILENKIKSIDLTVDELPNIDGHTPDINEEYELPAVNLSKDDSKDDIVILNKVERREIVISPNYDSGNNDVNSKNNMDPEKKPLSVITVIKNNIDAENKPISVITESKNTEDIGVDNPIEEPNSNLVSVLRNDVSTLVPFSRPHKKDLVNKNISKAATVNTCPIVLQHSHTSEVKEKAHEIHPARLLLQEQAEIESQVKENVAYNKDDGKKFIALPNTINQVPELNDKPKLPVIELWKSYIKELPPSESATNYNEVKTSENSMTYALDNKQVCTEENYNRKSLVGSPGTCNHVPKVKEDLKLSATKIPKYNNTVMFVPPYKNANTEGTGNRTPYSQVNFKNKPSILSSTPQIDESQRLLQNIEQSKCLQEIRTYNQTSTCDNQSTSIYRNINNDNVQPNTTSLTTEFDITLQDRQGLNYKDTTSDIGNRLSFGKENCNNNYSNANNQKHFINKYSFSSNNIDVSTKKTADHVVRIIRKLKIDLDVTEIISENNRTTGNQQVEEYIKLQIDDDEETPNIAFKKPKLSIAPSTENCYDKTKAMVTNYSSNDGDSIGIYNPKTQPNFDNSTTVQKFSENNKCFSQSNASATAPTNSKCDRKYDVIEENSQSIDDNDNFTEYKIANSPVERQPNNVESILQKYSNIMRNHTRNLDPSSCQVKTNEKFSSAPKKDKPKRPFKISDIHRLDSTTMPSAMIEKPKVVNVTECYNLLKPNDKHNLLEQNRQLNIFPIPTPKELVVEKEYNEETLKKGDKCIENLRDTSLCDPSAYKALEIKDTISDIDQTMFNPKTLLQCFSKDESEDIVPPPPEFSDYLNTSDPNSDITLPMECYDPMVWEEEIELITDKRIDHRDMFQDDSNVELTPSEPIETCFLSQDENCKMYASPGTSPYSFTIMRKNKEQTIQNDSLLLNTTHSRRNKLKQFKFNHKNKFKLGLM